MKKSIYIRIFFVVLIACACGLLFSYTHRNVAEDDTNQCDGVKCCEKKKSPSEFVLWESIYHNLLSVNQ